MGDSSKGLVPVVSAARLAGPPPTQKLIKFGATPIWKDSLPTEVMQARGWRETEDDDWDFYYADVGWIHENLPYSGGPGHVRLNESQRLNHFPNHVELTRKDLMAKNLKRAKRALEKEGRLGDAAAFDFFPQTFTLPQEYAMFVRAFKELGGLWIMKPIGRAQGKGIFLVHKLGQVEAWMKERGQSKAENPLYENYVAQRYVSNPYLVGGRKFDMRIYVLCLSYAPLKVYLYREGFARFTSSRFSLTKEELANSYIHLTNHAVQKRDENYNPDTTDLKWPLRSLRLHLMTKHGAEAANKCFHGILMVIVNALRAVQPVMINDKHCCELYGYDILLDDVLKPWLVEVNASPSLSSDTQVDKDLKFALIDDMLSVIDLEGRFEGRTPTRVGGFDLIVDQNQLVYKSEATSLTSMLGCFNDRERQLRKLFAKKPS